MAKLKSITTNDGVTHSGCIWLPMIISINHVVRQASIVFVGYHNIQALSENKSPITSAYKQYDVGGDNYLALAMSSVNNGVFLNEISQQCYNIAMNTLDTDDGSGELVSFFHNCEDISI